MPRDLRDRLTVILVEPRYAGNVGFVARVMMNFGVTRLALVNPCPMTNEGRDRAVHAQRVLDEAPVYATAAEAYEHFDHLAAFSARVSTADRSHLRNPVSLLEAAPAIRAMDGEVALVFGREDDGLHNHEVEPCDVVLQIPTNAMYRSMNLSHAVGVALYEMFREAEPEQRVVPASHREKELMHAYYGVLLDALRYQPHRKDVTLTALRRIFGRAGLSKWEFHRVMGVVSSSLKHLGKWPVEDLPELPPIEGEDAEPRGGADREKKE